MAERKILQDNILQLEGERQLRRRGNTFGVIGSEMRSASSMSSLRKGSEELTNETRRVSGI